MTGAAATRNDPPPTDPEWNSNHYALVIGIQNYNEFPSLKAPNLDAARFCRWLIETAKVPRENIQLVSGETRGLPTNSDIIAALEKLGLRMRTATGGRFYLYYAGHGVAPNRYEIALVPADARIGGLQGQLFGMAEWVKHLCECLFFEEVVLFLDCCRQTEAATPIGFPFSRLANPNVAQDFVPRSCILVGSVLGGSAFDIPLGENESQSEEMRGLMTEVLLQGLGGAHGAVDFQTNAVTTESLEHYVRTRVAALAKARNLPQQASVMGQEGDPIVLLQLNKVPELTLNVTVGAETSGKALELYNFRTGETVALGSAAAGETIPPVQIATDTRWLLTDNSKVKVLLDPVQMGNPHDVILG